MYFICMWVKYVNMHYSFSRFYFSLIYRIIFINSIVFGCLNLYLCLFTFSAFLCRFYQRLQLFMYLWLKARPPLLQKVMCSFRRDTHGELMEEEDMQWSSHICRIIPHDQRDRTDVMQSLLHSVLFFGKMEMQCRFLSGWKLISKLPVICLFAIDFTKQARYALW